MEKYLNSKKLAAIAALLALLLSFAAPAAAQTQALTPGEKVTGALETPAETDEYTFTLPADGCVTAELTSAGAGKWKAELFSGEVELAETENGIPGEAVGLAAGSYKVRVSPVEFSTAEYSLTVDFRQTSDWEKELNDSEKNATAIETGKKFYGALSSPQDKDYYAFTLKETEFVKAVFSADETSAPAWGFTLLDSGMNELHYDTLKGSGSSETLELAAGKYYFEVVPVDYSSAKYAVSVMHSSEKTVTRLGGENRIDTAIEISREGWSAGSANAVIIANAFNYPDALAGVPLAAKMNLPILLTRGEGGVESAVAKEIKRLGAKKAYILGGEAAVSAATEKELKSAAGSVERIAGDNRYQTAAAVAEKLSSLSGGLKQLFFASAADFPDALSVSPVAALSGGAVLYMPKSGKIDAATAEFVKSSGCRNGTVVGGSAAVSDEGLESIKALGLKVERVSGSDRYDTSVKICEKYAKLFTGSGIAAATGTAFPDALAGGVLAAKQGMPVVLVKEPVPPVTANYIKAANAPKFYIFGGVGAVSEKVEKELTK